ncbi:hypothetical protein Tsubulata_013912 [Turnera subulata]|uniref:GTD-binding domain-containing protein n=1 Tax=Turnera subulata TaxID=218843 RepID=A0A9Q0GCA3_9ROSI|nr:hypothetical protein Tsubulata_013912 [Turnera subulata]
MAFTAIHSWTLAGLMEAFVDLGIAYFLLWISAFAFLPCKVLSVLGLCRACPCNGTFGCQNSNLFLHKVLIDWPTAHISSVQELLRGRFPFDLIGFTDQSPHLRVEEVGDRKCEIRVTELEGGSCSNSFSGTRLQSSVEGESGYDAKGKKIVHQKSKSGIRRRKKAPNGIAKSSSALPSNTPSSLGTGIAFPSCDGSDMRTEISESFDPASGMEDSLLDYGNALHWIDSRSDIESKESLGKGEGVGRDSLLVEKVAYNTEDRQDVVGNDANVIRKLEQALAEEKAAHAALYQELEKERAAAASAADEAMAMILRLQEEKASIVMELRQYQRMIEETFTHDEEEMDILKEIIVRRERENHSLLMELEAYRHTDNSDYEQPEGDLSYNLDDIGHRPALSINFRGNKPLTMQQIHTDKFVGGKEVITNETVERSSGLISQGTMITQTHNGTGEGNEQEGKSWIQLDGDAHGCILDTESTIFDVHVIDDETICRKDDVDKERGAPLSQCGVNPVVGSDEILCNTPSSSMTEIEPISIGSYLDSRSELPDVGHEQCKTLKVDLQKNSSVKSRSLKLDFEVEGLRERLRIMQEETRKLDFSTEHQDSVSTQLKLVEDMVKQLEDIKQLREQR